MAKDAGDMIGSVIGTLAKELGDNVSHDGKGNGNGHSALSRAEGALSGARGVAAGAALAAAVPVAGMAAKKVVLKKVGSPSKAAKKAAEGASDKLSGGVKEAVSEKVGEAGSASGMVKEVGKKMIPGLGGSGDSKGKEDASGAGKGRRMPIQQEVDVGVPLSVAYKQWTQFEEWPQFMHRIDQVSQEDDGTVSFRTKIWGFSKQFVAEIVEQRPDERIQWKVKEGVAHTGVVSFHELAPNLTRVQVTVDVEPGSLLEKAARGMRHTKRAVRGDLHRFKAFVEMQEEERKPSSRGSSSGGRSRAKKRSASGSRKRGSSSKGKSKSRRGSSRS